MRPRAVYSIGLLCLALSCLPCLPVACGGHDTRERDDRATPTVITVHDPMPATGSVTDLATDLATGSAGWHYTFKPSADLARMDTRVCFPGRVPERFDAQMPASRWSLLEARRHPGGEPLQQRVDGLDLAALRPGDCIDYSLDLNQVLRRAKQPRHARRVAEDLYLSPDYWLWKPIDSRVQGGHTTSLTATFDMPDGLSMSVPWPRTGDNGPYRIPETTFLWQIPATIGHSPDHTIDIPGARAAHLRVAVLGDVSPAHRKRVSTWLGEAARAVSQLGGRFPREFAQAIVLPGAGDSVGFGFATHGGGGSVVITVGTQVSERTLATDWVGVHELLHLGTPMMDDESRWLSEGLSTYYEPLVRARAGLMTPTQAWEQLHDGFIRGRSHGSGRVLRKECLDMHETHAYWRVYWAGAAIALLADTDARRRGSSLDSELEDARQCCLEATEIMSADRLMARRDADGTWHMPYLRAAAARHLDSAEFPDVTPAYRTLGLSFDDAGHVTLSSDPRQRALRESITGAE